MEKEIVLKRNSFLIFILRFLPVILVGVTFIVTGIYTQFPNIAKIVNIAVLLVAFRHGLNPLKRNNLVMRFYEKFFVVGKFKKEIFNLQKIVETKNIKEIKISESPRKILVELNSGEKVYLWNREILSSMYNEQFYTIVDTLNKFYPNFTTTEENGFIIKQLSHPSFWEEVIEEDLSKKKKIILGLIFLFLISGLQLLLCFYLVGITIYQWFQGLFA